MSSLSHRSQLLLAGAAGASASAAFFLSYSSYSRRKSRAKLNDDVLASIASNNSMPSAKPPATENSYSYDEVLIREQLARNYAFFGDEGMEKIRNGSVAIIGCGGVGSAAAVMLARSGVKAIRLVDFDYVTLSSLNRHATASLADVGTPKVQCISNFIAQVCRWVEVDCRVDIWRKENGEELLAGVDWVVDAIDNIQTKVDLLKYCHDHKIKVFSSMGAGAKCDPTRVQISDISYTVYDPLARSVRRRLRLEGVSSGIPVVYSTEVPSDVKLLPLPEEEFQKGSVKELGVFDDFRVRILPVFGPLPSIFGLHIVSYITCELAGKPIHNPLPIKNRKKLYEKLLRDLQARESEILGEQINRLPIDEDDVAFLFEDLYRGRSLIPPHDVPSRPILVRWDLSQPLSIRNCVVMDAKDAEKHVNLLKTSLGEYQKPVDVWGTDLQSLVDQKAEEIGRYIEWNSF